MNGIRISIDTNIILNVINREKIFFNSSKQLLDKISNGDIHGVISTIVLSEVLTGFYMNNDMVSPKMFKEGLIENPNFLIVPVTSEIADLAAKIRSNNNIKLPDAIIISTAVISKSDYLVSNDSGIYKNNKIKVVNSNEILKILMKP